MTVIEYAYKHWFRDRVFRQSSFDPELAHEWGIRRLELLQSNPALLFLARVCLTYQHPALPVRAFGLNFVHPFGLAAGFDKYCQVYHGAIPACGWAFADVGGITRYQQDGNPRPGRMMRSEELRALWNFMGFNNPGADRAAGVMKRNPQPRIPVGLNVGKSKVTSLDQAADDYCYTIRRLWPFVDFITLNPSSPNTPGLRSLQNKENLKALVQAAQRENREMADFFGVREPKALGVKISPDESDEQLSDIVEVCRQTKVDFVEATNTTVSRDCTLGWDIPADKGGVSGPPLRSRAIKVQRELYRQLGHIPIIGVGGIDSGEALYQRILNGATLCRAYTAWPFEGPDFVKRCLKTLVSRLKSDGFPSVTAAVGAALR